MLRTFALARTQTRIVRTGEAGRRRRRLIAVLLPDGSLDFYSNVDGSPTWSSSVIAGPGPPSPLRQWCA